MNLLFSYNVSQDNELDAAGHIFLGAGVDSQGVEVHVFRNKHNVVYPNGEHSTKSRIEDEPWYSDYQTMMELSVRNSFGDSKGLLSCFESDFLDVFGKEPTPEQHARFERWAVYLQGLKDECEKGESCA